MTSKRHTLVLSPHLDDGILSCGGEMAQLLAAGEHVTMATLFTADMRTEDMSTEDMPTGDLNPAEVEAEPTPFARQVFHYMDLDWRIGMAARRQEDLAACRVLGVEPLHFDLGEAINRYVESAEGLVCPYSSAGTLFGPPDACDEQIVSDRLDAILTSLPPTRRWLVPLGIGGHVDHRLVRSAAERIGPRLDIQLVYYEDFPYSRKFKNRVRVLGLPWQRTMKTTTVRLEAMDLERKIEAIAAYRSQVAPLFDGRQKLAKAVHGDATRCGGGERRWR